MLELKLKIGSIFGTKIKLGLEIKLLVLLVLRSKVRLELHKD